MHNGAVLGATSRELSTQSRRKMGAVFGKVAEELPRSVTVHTAATYQVRRYEPSIAATHEYGEGGWGSASDRSPFGALARYIGVFSKPHNVKQEQGRGERIAMTAPVYIDTGERPTHTMMFLLPHSVYGGELTDAVPRPTNPSVRLVQLPERLQAVRRFSGNLGASRAQCEAEQLLADLSRDGWRTKASADGREAVEWTAAGFNAPFVLPWFKTNEVLVSVEERSTM